MNRVELFGVHIKPEREKTRTDNNAGRSLDLGNLFCNHLFGNRSRFLCPQLHCPNREGPRSFAYGERVLNHADDGTCSNFTFVHRELGRHVRRIDWVQGV